MTKEDLNRITNTFKRDERLKSKQDIASLFKKGSYFVFKPIYVRYVLIVPATTLSVKAAFVVPKKKIKRAVDRNLIKRRITAAFRVHKHEIYSLAQKKPLSLHTLFVYNSSRVLHYSSIEQAVKSYIHEIKSKIVS